MKLILFSLLLSQAAHAGVWERICNAFIMEDPYQFETASIDWVTRRIDQPTIKETWGKLTPQDETELRILRSEVRSRAMMEK